MAWAVGRPKPEGREPIAKVPDVFAFQGPFPLTPALSLREREKQKPRCDNSKPLPLSAALPVMLPLPEGEGRGEGEQIVRIPDRCDFCNRLPNSKNATDPAPPSLTGETFSRFTFPLQRTPHPLYQRSNTD